MFPINSNCSNNILSKLNINLKFTTIHINILHILIFQISFWISHFEYINLSIVKNQFNILFDKVLILNFFTILNIIQNSSSSYRSNSYISFVLKLLKLQEENKKKLNEQISKLAGNKFSNSSFLLNFFQINLRKIILQIFSRTINSPKSTKKRGRKKKKKK